MAPKETERRGSQLFTVRLWIEDMGEGRTEHRGLVRHVLSGAAWHFRDWEDLRRSMVSALERYDRRADDEASTI
jgi:hypothetical protein